LLPEAMTEGDSLFHASELTLA